MATPIKRPEERTNEYVTWRVSVLFPLLENLAVNYTPKVRKDGLKKKSGGVKGWKALAIAEAVILKRDKPDSNPIESEKLYTNAIHTIWLIRKELTNKLKTDLQDPKQRYPVQTVINHFGKCLSEQFAPYQANKNKAAKAKYAAMDAADEYVTINIEEHLKQALRILVDASEGVTKHNLKWEDVSCALALVTGRRMGEIHCTAAFINVGDYTLKFTGQLKGKSRRVNEQELRNHEFTIPTLAPANLVVAGLKWLEDKGKRIDKNDDVRIVNKRYSKALGLAVKANWQIVDGDQMKYHNLRAAYLTAAVKVDKPRTFKYRRYAQNILGDEDMSVISIYEKYQIEEGTLARV